MFTVEGLKSHAINTFANLAAIKVHNFLHCKFKELDAKEKEEENTAINQNAEGRSRKSGHAYISIMKHDDARKTKVEFRQKVVSCNSYLTGLEVPSG